MMSKVAAVQLNSTDSIDENLTMIRHWVAKAAEQHAKLILLPENCAYMPGDQGQTKDIAEPLRNGPIQDKFSRIAAEYNVWLVVGAFAIIDSGKVHQTQLVYNDSGKLLAHYHKRHLFDVTLPEGKESYRESDAFVAGDTVIAVDSPFAKIGLSICYDLRFPEHFRMLVDKGAELLLLPAAFTYNTGKAHWEVLLRARAIENQCYVLASAQCGKHASGRATWGQSMLINPWGEIIAKLSHDEGILVGDINLSLLKQQRNTFPALKHRK